MEVKLLHATPLDVAIKAIRKCWDSGDRSDSYWDWKTDYDEEIKKFYLGPKDAKLIRNVIANGHDSTLEHIVFSFDISGISRACSHQLVRHRMASYCLAGDTIIPAFKTHKKYHNKSWTMKQLYEWSLDPKRKGRLKLMRLRGVDKNGILTPVHIKNIIYSGEQQLYKITTKSGRTIRATENHLFLTQNGWKKLSELVIDDRLKANGLPAHVNKEWLKEKYLDENMERQKLAELCGVADSTLGKIIAKYGLQKPKSQYPNRQPGYGKKGATTLEGRLRLSQQKLRDNNPGWKGDNITISGGYNRSNKWFPKNECYFCGATENLENHHWDGNPRNSDEDNIVTLCIPCHKSIKSNNVMTVFNDPIVSIEIDAVEDTYDIEIQEEIHNFVANGLVVHNSQRSQRYVNEENFEYVIPNSLNNSADALVSYGACMHDITWAYNHLIELGIPKEDARFVLPNACETSLVMTINARSLRNFFKLRMDKHAQWEIRELAMQMYNQIKNEYGILFEDIMEGLENAN